LYDAIVGAHSVSLNDNTTSNSAIYDTQKNTRLSYYTPPSGTRSAYVLPLQLLGHRERQLFHERIVIGGFDQEPKPLEKMGAEDMFGWANMSDGSWHNSVTGEKKDTSPMSKTDLGK
jgi:hypothetical protein